MAEIPDWFPDTIEELYRPDPGEPPSIDDPRVASSHGGGACPEQHWGVLTDGRLFYFRYRSGYARVNLAPEWFEHDGMPTWDPRVSWEEWTRLYESGLRGADLPSLWLGPVAGVVASDDEYEGSFSSPSRRAEVFAQCLDQIWDEPFDLEGWNLLREPA